LKLAAVLTLLFNYDIYQDVDGLRPHLSLMTAYWHCCVELEKMISSHICWPVGS